MYRQGVGLIFSVALGLVPNAKSGDNFGNSQMGFMREVESGTNAFGQLGDGQGAIRFEDMPLGMEPGGFDGIKPGAFGGQRTNQETNAQSGAFDLLVMGMYPGSDRFAAMPGSVIPDQCQNALVEGMGFVAQPGEELGGEGADGS